MFDALHAQDSPDSAGEALYVSLFERFGLSMASLGPDIRLREVNTEFARQFNHPVEGVLGRSFYELLHAGTKQLLRRHFERLVDGRRNSFTERVVAVRPSATVLSGELTGVAVRLGSRGLDSITLLLRPEKRAGQEAQIERRSCSPNSTPGSWRASRPASPPCRWPPSCT